MNIVFDITVVPLAHNKLLHELSWGTHYLTLTCNKKILVIVYKVMPSLCLIDRKIGRQNRSQWLSV